MRLALRHGRRAAPCRAPPDALAAARPTRATCAAGRSRRCCSTVMCGNNAYDWNIMLTGRSCGGTLVMSTSSIRMRPPLGLREARQHAQQRRLAAARGAHQREHLALVDAQIDVVDRGEGAEGLVDALDDDLRLGVGIEPRAIGRRFLRRRRHAGLKVRRRRCAAPLRREEWPLHDPRSRHATLPHEFSVQVDLRPDRRTHPEIRRIDHSKRDVALASRRPDRRGHAADFPLARLRSAYSSALWAGLLPAMSRPTSRRRGPRAARPAARAGR